MKVTIIRIDGKVSLAKLDRQGRMIWRSDQWVPGALSQEHRDRWLRLTVAKVIKDGGRLYKRGIRHI